MAEPTFEYNRSFNQEDASFGLSAEPIPLQRATSEPTTAFTNSPKDLPILPYEIEITGWETKPARHESGVGYLQTSMVYLADGSQYVVRKIIAEKPAANISADFMPPLATRTKGFNKYVGRELAIGGINNRLVGTNRGRKYSLEHDAQAFLTILNYDDLIDPSSKPSMSLELGYSMGAMKGLGAFTLAHMMNREQFGILVDPCLAEPIDYSKENLRDVLAYLKREAQETGRIIKGDARDNSLGHTFAHSMELMGTFSFSPAFLRNMYDKWRIVATGEAGTFPPKIPMDAAIVIHFFNESRYNDMEKYKALFSEHTNVRIQEEEGLHMTGGCPAYIAQVVSRAQTAVHLIEDGASKGDFAEYLHRPMAA